MRFFSAALVTVALLSGAARADRYGTPVSQPAQMRGRFERAIRFHEKGLAQLAAAAGRISARSAGEPDLTFVYQQLGAKHRAGLRVAQQGLAIATERRPIAPREDAHAEAAAHMERTFEEWRVSRGLRGEIVQLGGIINSKR